MELRRIFLAASWILLTVSLWISFGAAGWGALTALTLLLNLSNILLAYIAFKQDNSFLKIYVFVFAFSYLFRIPVLIGDPLSHFHIGWPFWILISVTLDDIREALGVLLLYQILGGFVISIAWIVLPPVKLWSASRRVVIGDLKVRQFLWALWIWFVILASWRVFFHLVLQGGRNLPLESGIFRYTQLFVATDVVEILTWIVILAHYRTFARTQKMMVYAFLLLFSFSHLVTGSRGFLVALLLVMIVFWLVTSKYVRLRLFSWRNVQLSLLGLFAILAIVIGFSYRAVYRNPALEFSFNRVVEYARENPITARSLWQWGSYRASYFDEFSMMVWREDSRFAHTISLSNAVKVIANWLIPGAVFLEGSAPVVPSHRALLIDYGGQYRGGDPGRTTYKAGLYAVAISNLGVVGGTVLVSSVIFGSIVVLLAMTRMVRPEYRGIWFVYGNWMFFSALVMTGLDIFVFSIGLFGVQFVMFSAFRALFNR